MVARPPRFSRRPRSFLNGRRSFDFEHRRTTLERIAKGGKRRAKTSRNWICALEGDIRSGLSLCWNRKVYRRTRQFCWRHEPTLFWKATGSDGNAVRVHPAFGEVTVGALIVFGLFTRVGLTISGLLLIGLTFGTVMLGDFPTVAHNVQYGLVNFVLLWLGDLDRFSIDHMRTRGVSTA